jgi:hypothetical protein
VDHCNQETENLSRNPDGVPIKPDESISSVSGGIFIFLSGPRPVGIEYNLSCAINYYGAAKRALFAFPVNLAETSTIFKKKGWAFNELSCCRLGRGNLSSAEIAFADM